MSKRRESLSPGALKSTWMRGTSRPYSFKSAGFSSTTRTISSCVRALVMPVTWDSSAPADVGSTSCQPASLFLSAVVSPDST